MIMPVFCYGSGTIMPLPLIEQLATAIRTERKRRKLTQPQLAISAGISERALRQIEAGKGTARLDIIARLLDALDLGIEITPHARYPQGPAGPTGPMVSPPLLGNAGRLRGRGTRPPEA
jgi:HTH-type transcriptional regulator/antitoxin HipB